MQGAFIEPIAPLSFRTHGPSFVLGANPCGAPARYGLGSAPGGSCGSCPAGGAPGPGTYIIVPI